MKRVLRHCLWAVAIVIALSVGAVLVLRNMRPTLDVKPVAAAPGKGDGPSVTFMGVSTLLFADGDRRVLIDGFFTRPSLPSVMLRRIGPDEESVRKGLLAAKVEKLEALFVAHSHYDHAMDSPIVVRRVGGVLVGSRSSRNIALGEGLPLSRTRILETGKPYEFDPFKVRAFASRHSASRFFGFPGEIPAGFGPPARANDYREGGTYSFAIEHRAGTFLVHPSANFRPCMYADTRADVVFLGIAGLGGASKEFVEDFWSEVVLATGARWVIPIHWDDFMLPLDGTSQPQPMPRLFDDVGKGMHRIMALADRDKVQVRMLPAWQPIDVLHAMRNECLQDPVGKPRACARRSQR